MNRIATDEQTAALLDTIRQLEAHLADCGTATAKAFTAYQDSERARANIAGRLERTWALFRLHVSSAATSKPLPDNVDAVGTPAMVPCRSCGGAGCTGCGGMGVEPNEVAFWRKQSQEAGGR